MELEVETVAQRGPTTSHSEVVEAALTLRNLRRQYLENKDRRDCYEIRI